ncbi:MAG: hypothetical protein HYW48_07480 [Deltaproteobacteria bacterium]|nr:hypothetical protein [Deltaproteobacteria bacterium]
MKQGTKGQQITFYIDEIWPRGNEVLRLAYLFLLNRKAAFECANETFERVVDNLDRLRSDNLPVFLAGACWKAFQEQKQHPSVDATPFAASAGSLELKERAALGFADLFDLPADKAAKLQGLGVEEFQKALTRAREKNEVLARKETGILQGLYEMELSNEETRELRLKISTEEIQKNLEVLKIEELTRQEGFKAQSRRWMILSFIIVVIFGVFYSYFHTEKIGFDPVQSLAWEALHFESGQTGARLLLPSSDEEELRQYLEQYPGLNFKPFLLQLGAAWELRGASIIDYEVAKVAVVQFVEPQRKENVFHFTFAGRMDQVPPSEAGQSGTLSYRAYGSQKINLIVWQHDENTLSMLAGHLSAPDLAGLAAASP